MTKPASENKEVARAAPARDTGSPVIKAKVSAGGKLAGYKTAQPDLGKSTAKETGGKGPGRTASPDNSKASAPNPNRAGKYDGDDKMGRYK